MPRVNTNIGDGYVGIGDMVSLAWIAEGTRGAGRPLTFHAVGDNLTVLRLLRQDASQEQTGDEAFNSAPRCWI